MKNLEPLSLKPKEDLESFPMNADRCRQWKPGASGVFMVMAENLSPAASLKHKLETKPEYVRKLSSNPSRRENPSMFSEGSQTCMKQRRPGEVMKTRRRSGWGHTAEQSCTGLVSSRHQVNSSPMTTATWRFLHRRGRRRGSGRHVVESRVPRRMD